MTSSITLESAVKHARPLVDDGRRRRGLTLIEIMIATTLSLLLILVLAQSFASVSGIISKSRATLEMAERMRGTMLKLTQDLDGVSVPALPWSVPAAGGGYLEITEGRARDYDANANGIADWSELQFATALGDGDDIIAMTVFNDTTPFVGYVMGSVTAIAGSPGRYRLDTNAANPKARTRIISSVAEVIWWTVLNDRNGNGVPDGNDTYTLHRRVLLVRPDIVIGPTLSPANMPAVFFAWGNDLSTSLDASGNRVTNSLEDLSERGRRSARAGTVFPYQISRANLLPQQNVWLPGPDNAWGVRGVDDDGNGITDGNDLGEAGALNSDDILIAEVGGQDVMLTDVLAFDIKVFDPQAALKDSTNGYDLLAPDDPRYSQLGVTTLNPPTGAFVDLAYSINLSNGSLAFPIPFGSSFSAYPQRKSTRQLAWALPTWDTWPLAYETDGIDNDDIAPSPLLIDEGFDGIDNDNANGVDDMYERETQPPYSAPLRGIKIVVRVVDQSSRQVRQEHVVASFRPE